MAMLITRRKLKHLAKGQKRMAGIETGLIKTEMIVTGLMKIKKIVETRNRYDHYPVYKDFTALTKSVHEVFYSIKRKNKNILPLHVL